MVCVHEALVVMEAKKKERANWCLLRDRNISFFNLLISFRGGQNSIVRNRGDEVVLTQPAEIKAKVVGYHSNLFSNNRWNRPNIGSDGFMRPDSRSAMELENEVTLEKGIDAVWSCDGSKAPAPGSDGFNFAFYKKAWHLVGEEIFDMVGGVLNSGRCSPYNNLLATHT